MVVRGMVVALSVKIREEKRCKVEHLVYYVKAALGNFTARILNQL